MEAELVLSMCDRFHCLPSAVYEEDASLLRLLQIESIYKEDEEVPEIE